MREGRKLVTVALCFIVLSSAGSQVALGARDTWDSELSAFGVLEELAEHAEASRLSSGYATIAGGIIAGILIAGVSYAILPDYPQYALLSGAAIAAFGVASGMIALNRPTLAEKAYADVLTHSEGERERKSYSALIRLADAAHEQRILRAVAYGASGLASLVMAAFSPSRSLYYGGFYSLGMAGYKLFFPSREERALASYDSFAVATEAE